MELAPTGKKILLIERGGYVRARTQTGARRSLWLKAGITPKKYGAIRTARLCIRTRTIMWAATPSSIGAALFRFARRISVSCATTAGSRRLADQLCDLEPYYTAGRESLPRPRAARRRSDGSLGAAGLIRIRRQPRAAHPAAQRRLHAARACKPFHVPLGVMLDETDSAQEPLHPLRTCDGFPCLVHAKSDAQVRLRGSGARASECYPADERFVSAARDDALRPRGDNACMSSATVTDGDLLGGHRGLRLAARSTRPPCCFARRAISTRAAWPMAPTWWAVTTWATSIRCSSPSRAAQPHDVSRRPWRERLLLRVARVGVPDGPHLLRRQVRRRTCSRPAHRRSFRA